jgi:hypothetical protein
VSRLCSPLAQDLLPGAVDGGRRWRGEDAPVLIVDAANVVGSRPTGWWRDRAGAARELHGRLVLALAESRLDAPVLLVLEGAARAGVEASDVNGLRVVHAARDGDQAIVDMAGSAGGAAVTVVTADRELRRRVTAVGAEVVGPRWLLDRLG